MRSGLPPVARRALARNRGSVAAKLYLFAILSIVAVAALAASSIYFARATETAANRLYDQGFLGTLGAARLGVLLEQHRRLVESMPSEVDRERIDKARRDLDTIKRRLTELIGGLTAENRHLSPNAPELRIRASLTYLFDAGDEVVFYDEWQKAYTSNGASYNVDPGGEYFLAGDKSGTHMQPGNTIHAELPFKIPQSTKLEFLDFHDDAFSAGVLIKA